MTDSALGGVVVPILTPLKPDKSVDTISLRRLVGYLIDGGVHGIWASGTTGEFAALSDRDRLISMETVVDEVSGRIPVIGNISGTSTQMAVSLAVSAQEIGLTGIAATPPYYYPSGQDELLEHYSYIRERVGLPLWVYNIPQTVKTVVAPGTIATLASRNTVVGIKDSSGAGELLAELNVLCDQSDIALLRFIGSVFRITSAGAVGAHGVIPGIANLVPAIAVKAWQAGKSGDIAAARTCNAHLMVAGGMSHIAKGGSANSATFSTMKSALKVMGILDHDTVSRPMRSLTEEEKQQIPQILKQLDLLN